MKNPFRYFKTSPEIIRLAVTLESVIKGAIRMGLLITAITIPNSGLNLYEAKRWGQSQGEIWLEAGRLFL